jgi:serine/threonine protein kinase
LPSEIQKHAFINNKNTLALFEREIDIIGRLNHVRRSSSLIELLPRAPPMLTSVRVVYQPLQKNVCKFIEALEDDERIYIILEVCLPYACLPQLGSYN